LSRRPALAHEINQPLTAIVTNAQAARRLLGTAPAEPVPVQEALADITEDALRASQVIRRLRALMGLAISRSIVQAHGGRIWATANANMGLTMHVELPVHADQ
jgi:signal transduction histidine kinase